MCLQYVLTRLDLLRVPKAGLPAPAEGRPTETPDLEREPVGAAR